MFQLCGVMKHVTTLFVLLSVKALEIYQKTKQPDLRLLAEVNYKVGLCYMMEREFEESINSFKGAVTELEKVVEEEKAKEQTDDIKETIQDLEQMKQEILEKIADVEEAMKTVWQLHIRFRAETHWSVFYLWNFAYTAHRRRQARALEDHRFR